MFTFFHLLALVGMVAGAVLGARAGLAMFGILGAVIGAMAGGVVGLIAGKLPFNLALGGVARCLARQSTSELRAAWKSGSTPVPNLVLLELRRRGEDIRSELPLLLEMLVSPDVGRRCLGWAALTSAFPELMEQLRDYRPADSLEECRKNSERLRQSC
jgi:hypothetical protein